MSNWDEAVRAMSLRTIAVAGAPIASSVEVHVAVSPDKWLQKTANAQGYAAFVWDSSLSDSDIRITASGFQPYLTHVKWKPVNHQVTIGVDLPTLVPSTPPLPQFTVQGHDFIGADGKRVVLCGTDGFCDLGLQIAGADLEAFAAESQECGFTARRIWLMGDQSDNQVLQLYPQHTQNYFAHLQNLVRFWNGEGVVPFLDCIVNGSLVMPSHADQIAFWNQVSGALPPSDFVYILNGGNEWSHAGAGFDPNQWPTPPAGVVWSRGSNQQDGLTAPNGAPCTCFHQRRDIPKTLDDAVASATDMIYHEGYGCALIMDEGFKFDEASDPAFAWQQGRLYSALWAMAVFHNVYGQRGQLMGSNTKTCAKAFRQGMRL